MKGRKPNWTLFIERNFREEVIDGKPHHCYWLGWKKIGDEEIPGLVDQISVRESKNDKQLLVDFSNKIGDEGCLSLSKANWQQLTNLDLHANNIGKEGCLYLSKANWQNLTNLQLYNNKIEDEGCKYLSRANWQKLITLNLIINKMGLKGCEYLSQAIWPRLQNLSLPDSLSKAAKQKIEDMLPWPVDFRY